MNTTDADTHKPDAPLVQPKQVMLVDDHPLVRQAIACLIRETPGLAFLAEAGCAEEALRKLAACVPDLLLLDISLPGVSGIELLQELRLRYSSLRILILSMHEESVYAERALQAGAHGYVMKQESGSTIIEAIWRVVSQEIYVSPVLARRLLDQTGQIKRESGPLSLKAKLSDRELQVFTLMGRGLSTQKIAESLALSCATIYVYREHLKRKLGLRNVTELVHHAVHWAENQ